MKKMWEFYRQHPNGPFSYGSWDSVPGRHEARPTYYRWLKLYRAMVEPGTQAFLEVTQSDLFQRPLPEGVVASVFANRNVYLALANYSRQHATVVTADVYRSCTNEAAPKGSTWSLEPRTLIVLQAC